MNKTLKAELMLLLVTFIWGATFLFTQIGLEYSPPFLYILMRFGIALGITVIFFPKAIMQLDKKAVRQGSVLGLLFGTGFMLQTYALGETTITKTAFITGLTVVVTPFVFLIVAKKQPKLWSKIGVAIAFVGLMLFTNPTVNEINLGDVLTLISTFCWAVYITFMDKFTKDNEDFSKTIQLVAMQFVFASILPTIGYFVFEHGVRHVDFSMDLLYSLLYNAVLASFVLTLIHTRYQKDSTPVKAALIFSLEPVFASAVAILFANEILSGREYIGAGVMLLGVLASEIGNYFYDKRNAII